MQIGLRIFFKRIYLLDKQNIPKKGAVLLASTHPNSFVDDILIAAVSKRSIIFLARADVFSSKIAKFLLKQVHVYPVYRGRDNKGDVQKNLDSFEFYENHLAKKKMLLIHPEGLCVNEKNVRPLKKGMGRIAFGAEEKNNWDLDIQIVPIGINYTNAPYEREEVIIKFGEAIPAKNYQSAFEENPAKAYTNLKDDITIQLKGLSIVQVKGTEDVSEKCLTLARNNLILNERGAISKEPHKFNHEKMTTDAVNNLFISNPEKFENLSQKVKTYFNTLESHNLLDSMIKNPPLRRWKILDNLHYLDIELPFIIVGLIFHQIPYNYSLKLTKNLIKSIEFRASILLGLNFFFFLILYAIIISLSIIFTGWWAILITAVIALGGLSLLDRKKEKADKSSYKSYRKLLKKQPELISKLESQRKEIWKMVVE